MSRVNLLVNIKRTSISHKLFDMIKYFQLFDKKNYKTIVCGRRLLRS